MNKQQNRLTVYANETTDKEINSTESKKSI